MNIYEEIVSNVEVVNVEVRADGVHIRWQAPSHLIAVYGTEAINAAMSLALRAGVQVISAHDSDDTKLCRWCGVNPVDDLRKRCDTCAGE